MSTIRSRAEIAAFFEFEDQPTAGEFADTWESVAFRQGTPHAVVMGTLIDLNAAAVNVLYTVPTGTRFVFTHGVVRGLSAAAAAAVGRFQTQAGGGNLIPSVAFTSILTGEVMRVQRDPATPYIGPQIAGDTIDFEVTTPAGATRTCRLDVFGYHLPASD